jgi:hypothetical protein
MRSAAAAATAASTARACAASAGCWRGKSAAECTLMTAPGSTESAEEAGAGECACRGSGSDGRGEAGLGVVVVLAPAAAAAEVPPPSPPQAWRGGTLAVAAMAGEPGGEMAVSRSKRLPLTSTALSSTDRALADA